MDGLAIGLMAAWVVGFGAFLAWYGGRGRPLSAGEIEARLDRIRASAGSSGDLPHLIEALREAARDDDGREFVMVNLIRFRDRAAYPPGMAGAMGDDPLRADARYNRAVVPRLLKRAGVPIFLGVRAGRFLEPERSTSWDRIALVRYRSRRDLLALAEDLARDRADVHKWAAIESTQVFPVRVPVALVFVRASVAVALAAGVGLGYLALRATGLG